MTVPKSAKASEPIKLFELDGVARKLNIGYAMVRELRKLIDDAEIATPAASFNVNGQDMWSEAALLEWKAVWDKHTEKERALEEERLNSETMKKSSMIEHLLLEAQALARDNSLAYSHNRGNSLADGRKRVLEFMGAYNFARKLLGDLKIPAEKLTEINELLDKAKSSVNMQ